MPEAIDAEVARLKLAAHGHHARRDDARAGGVRLVLAARHVGLTGGSAVPPPYGALGARRSPIDRLARPSGVVVAGRAAARRRRRSLVARGPARGGRPPGPRPPRPDGGRCARHQPGRLQRPHPASTSTAARRTLVAGDLVVVSDFATGRLHRVATRPSVRAAHARGRRGATPTSSSTARERLIAVREDHDRDVASTAVDNAGRDPARRSGEVARPRDGRRLLRGAAPLARRRAARLARVATTRTCPGTARSCCVAAVDGGRRARRPRDRGRQRQRLDRQPRWSPDGVLHFVAERTAG